MSEDQSTSKSGCFTDIIWVVILIVGLYYGKPYIEPILGPYSYWPFSSSSQKKVDKKEAGKHKGRSARNDVETYERVQKIISRYTDKLEHAVRTPINASQRQPHYALLITQMGMAIEKEIDMSSKRRKGLMKKINDTLIDLLNAYIRSNNKRLAEGRNYSEMLEENKKDQEKHILRLVVLTQELVKAGGVKGTKEYDVIQAARKEGLIEDQESGIITWIREVLGK